MKWPLALVGLAACPPAPPTVDLTAPTVTSSTPAAGASQVSTRTVLQVCFDGPLEPATALVTAIEFDRMDGHVARPLEVSVGLDASATCLGIAPSAPLSPSSHYQLTLKNTLLGANGIALGDSDKTDAYVASFSTVGAPATAVLLMPVDGMLNAPLDLAQIVIAFDAPVTLATGAGPFTELPGDAPSFLSSDGRLAFSLFPGAPAGTQIQLQLSPGLSDPSGQVPETGGPLGFTLGSCSEGSAPDVGGAVVVTRDVDAWLEFATDRPGLCEAAVEDPGSADAGVLSPTAATCILTYDPCQLADSCNCTLPIGALGAGDVIAITPELVGYDGQVGLGASTTFGTAAALPPVVLTEVFPGESGTAFVELQNRGASPIDLTGFLLADCQLSLGCSSPKTPVAFGPPDGVGSATVPADGYALLMGTAAATLTAPAGAILLTPLYGETMVHLSTTGYQSLALFGPGSAVPVSTYDGSILPQSGYSIERVDPGASDATPHDWALSTIPGGTPGACNSVTPGSACDPF